jgi:hypothetical protein
MVAVADVAHPSYISVPDEYEHSSLHMGPKTKNCDFLKNGSKMILVKFQEFMEAVCLNNTA